MNAVTLRRCGARTALTEVEAVVGIHAEVHADLPFGRDRYFGSDAFRERLKVAVWQPRFELCLAEAEDGQIAGLLYGWALPAHTRWWRPVVDRLPPELTAEDGSRSVFIQEIMVRRPWRRQGVARRMHDFFLTGRAERRALMCVLPDNEPAVGAYRRWGWRTVATAPFGPGEPVFDCLVFDLDTGATDVGERSAGSVLPTRGGFRAEAAEAAEQAATSATPSRCELRADIGGVLS